MGFRDLPETKGLPRDLDVEKLEVRARRRLRLFGILSTSFLLLACHMDRWFD